MQPNDTPFTPAGIDDQIDMLMGSNVTATPAQRLVRDLHAYYGAADDAALLAGAWARLQAGNESEQSERAISSSPGVPTVNDTAPKRQSTPAVTPTTMPHRGAEPPRRPWVGAIAALLVVALGVAVFALRPGGHLPPSVGIKGATPTPIARTQWVHVSQLDYPRSYSSGFPAIAPSDPNVVYEAYLAADKVTTAFRRTDDGGKTWKTFTLPVPGTMLGGEFQFYISPLEPRTVFVQIYETDEQYCPINVRQKNADTGSILCFIQYLSTDAGAHWQMQHLPLDGTFNTGNPLIQQGHRLFTEMGCYNDNFVCERIVTSTDGGLTWSLADAPIAASGQTLCNFSATATGTTLVVFAAVNCNYDAQPSPLHLWQSDDAGATWHDQGTVPAPMQFGGGVASDSDPAHPLIYADLPSIVKTTTNKMGGQFSILSVTATNVKATADGGKTWQSAPVAGIPTDQTVLQVMGTLPDGSVLAAFVAAEDNTDGHGGTFHGTTFFTWKLGDASWHPFGGHTTFNLNNMTVTTPDAPTWHVWMTSTSSSGTTEQIWEI